MIPNNSDMATPKENKVYSVYQETDYFNLLFVSRVLDIEILPDEEQTVIWNIYNYEI